MKKSKIIVPALGIIALSTAASITGTVAWFTASRSATISAGNFAVTKTTNNLKVVLSDGAGTHAADDETINVKDHYKLTDASFDHLEEKIYKPDSTGTKIADSPLALDAVSDTTGDNVRSSVVVNPGQQTEYTDRVLSVMTWDMAVSIEFGSVSGDMGLYLDTSASWVHLQGSPANPTYYTAKGFRIAFVPKDDDDASNGAVKRVWADLQTENIKHVNGSSSSDEQGQPKHIDGVAYTLNYLIDANNSTAIPDDTGANAKTLVEAQAMPTYLGNFAYQENTIKTLNYTVVCWYEGTDPEIRNRTAEAQYQTVQANIVLGAAKYAA